jgi:antitoxin (DNA-binding transcriptional repressor) of toxin-antitoxin stability system
MMHCMGRVSVRELQQNLRRIISRVERGEAVDVTRRQRLVARLVRPAAAAQPQPWPDLDLRARAVFGDRVISPPPSQQLVDDRGDR